MSGKKSGKICPLFPVMISRDRVVLWAFFFDRFPSCVPFAFSISLYGRLNNDPQRNLGPNPRTLGMSPYMAKETLQM